MSNWAYCISDNLPLGNHTIELRVRPGIVPALDGGSAPAVVWFDYFTYNPRPDVELSGKRVVIGDQSPLVVYDDEARWVGVMDSIGNGVHQTQDQGAKLNITFAGWSLQESFPPICHQSLPFPLTYYVGTAFTWYARLRNGSSTKRANATWALDGGPETPFMAGPSLIQTENL